MKNLEVVGSKVDLKGRLYEVVSEELSDIENVINVTSYGLVVSHDAKERLVARIIKELNLQ